MNISERGELSFDVLRYVHEDAGSKRLEKGDILFNNTNSIAWVGKTAVVATEDELAFSNHMTQIKLFGGSSDPRFVAKQLHFLQCTGYFQTLCKKHVNQASIATNSLTKEVPLRLPPLNEQHRIVTKLETCESRITSAREAISDVPELLEQYRQSVLAAAFRGDLTRDWRTANPDRCHKWRERTLGETSTLITSGSRGWAKYYSKDGPLFIRAQNINTNSLILDDVAHVSPPQSSEGKRTQVQLGDVLITITGANVAKTGWVNQTLEEAYVSQHVALVRPDPQIESEFLHLWLIAQAGGQKFLLDKAYGGGKPGLSLTNVRDVPVRIPSIPEQKEIVRSVRRFDELISQLSEITAKTTTDLTTLTQSLLAKAFRGQLVPQDPTDEPASALLARLRQQRESEVATKPKKKAKARKAR